MKQLRNHSLQLSLLEKATVGLKAHTIDSRLVAHQAGTAESNRSSSAMRASSLKRGSVMHGQVKKSLYSKQNGVDQDPYQTQSENLAYYEVKTIADEHNISCKAVYELHAEFNSMLKILEQEKLQKEAEQEIQHKNEEEEEQKEHGIPIDFYLMNSPLLRDKTTETQHNIIEALGMHIPRKGQLIITWNRFLKINTTLLYQSASKHEFIDFWLRFLNPKGRTVVSRVDFIDRIELLARGRFTAEKTLISENFANGLYLMLNAKGCTSVEDSSFGDVLPSKLKKRLNTGAIPLEFFNQTFRKDCEFVLDEEIVA